MTRRLTPKRLDLEAALKPADLETLREHATAYGIPADGWDRVPSLRTAWGTLAVLRRADRIRARSGISADTAQDQAAVELGISEETIRTRLKRFFDAARGL